MRRWTVVAALGLAAATAQAGRPHLALAADSPTTIVAGASVAFTLQFSQYQEHWSFSNNGPEPSADIGLQTWQFSFFEESTERLTGLHLQLGAPGGPPVSRVLAPDAAPGGDFHGSWSLSLPFAQAGAHAVQADAVFTQHKTMRRGQTLGTRECVGFDNSVQCSGWSFYDELLEDSVWTEHTGAASLPVLVQVQAVPEPATLALWVSGLLAAGAVAQRRRA